MTGHAAGALLVALGAAAGAPARWWVDRAVTRRGWSGGLPWGTLTVNVAGSLLLGLVAGLTVRLGTDVVALLLGTGFCGAFTTFSTFAVETVRLADAGRGRQAALNVGVSVVLGLVGAAAGFAAGVRL